VGRGDGVTLLKRGTKRCTEIAERMKRKLEREKQQSKRELQCSVGRRRGWVREAEFQRKLNKTTTKEKGGVSTI